MTTTTKTITLRELHARLGEVIAENEARGRGARNDLPVLVRMNDFSTRGGRGHYVPLKYAHSSMLTVRHLGEEYGLASGDNFMELECDAQLVRHYGDRGVQRGVLVPTFKKRGGVMAATTSTTNDAPFIDLGVDAPNTEDEFATKFKIARYEAPLRKTYRAAAPIGERAVGRTINVKSRHGGAVRGTIVRATPHGVRGRDVVFNVVVEWSRTASNSPSSRRGSSERWNDDTGSTRPASFSRSVAVAFAAKRCAHSTLRREGGSKPWHRPKPIS